MVDEKQAINPGLFDKERPKDGSGSNEEDKRSPLAKYFEEINNIPVPEPPIPNALAKELPCSEDDGSDLIPPEEPPYDAVEEENLVNDPAVTTARTPEGIPIRLQHDPEVEKRATASYKAHINQGDNPEDD